MPSLLTLSRIASSERFEMSRKTLVSTMVAAAICAHTLPDTIRCLTRGTRLLVRSHRSPSVATHTLSRPQLAARRFLTSTMAAADKVSVGDLDAAAVAAQGERVRSLKADKAEQSVIEREVATLKQLKAQLQAQQGSALAKESSSKSKKGKLALKTPKACSAFAGQPMTSLTLPRGAAGHQRLAPRRHDGPQRDLPQDHSSL